MTAGPTDPRLEFTVNDLMTLSAAVAFALLQSLEADRVRYQELAMKLAGIVIRTQHFADEQARHEQ
jgi:hypothetical protein